MFETRAAGRLRPIFGRIAAATCLLLAWPAGFAQEANLVVEGANDPARDVPAVQAAVDRGGSVVLKGTFDFGDSGSVSIRRDVEILGDLSSGQPSTKIKGGKWSLHSPLPQALPPQSPGPAITIRGIHFDNAAWAPIHIAYARSVVVSDNRITTVRPVVSPKPILGRDGLLLQQGISLGPFLSFPSAYPPNALTGEVRVERNFVDLAGTDPTNTLGQAILMVWATGARASFVDNTTLNASRNAIEALDNYPGKDGEGFVLIRGNYVTTPRFGLAFPGPSFPNGIVVGWFFDRSGGTDPARMLKHVVKDNQIRIRGETSMGVAVLIDGAVVANNVITCQGKGTRGVVLFGSGATVVGNRFQGSGAATVAFSGSLKPMTGSRNVVVGSDTATFRPSGEAVQDDGAGQGNLILE